MKCTNCSNRIDATFCTNCDATLCDECCIDDAMERKKEWLKN